MGRASRVAPACIRAGFLLFLPALTLALAACQPLAVLGQATNRNVTTPSYLGLKGQSIGVMAWADESLTFEHNMLILDLTRSVSQKLQGAQGRKADELKDATFPREKGPDAMFAFQRNHPSLAAEPIGDVAPRLGVSRLIYVEVSNFDLHAGAVVDLFKGNLKGTVTVVEVSNGKGKVALRRVVEASYPEHSAEEGTPNLTDQQTYIGTIDRFGTEVAKLFVSYPADD